ncbi:MAG: SMC-Scp complex subunit ScpB [bacterium]|nr:SMC-Scp complex subunit ScpB [bacterium]
MSSIKNQVESLLFISARPLTAAKIAALVKSKADEVKQALEELFEEYKTRQSGVKMLRNGGEWQLATAPESAAVVGQYLQEELSGELTRPQLETLTIIAYRGPIGKNELEQIRGVNCGLILRNLLIRGLIEVKTEEKNKNISYSITLDFLRFLGLTKVDELPKYEYLHSHEAIQNLLAGQTSAQVTQNT